jgi:hypothetical protein
MVNSAHTVAFAIVGALAAPNPQAAGSSSGGLGGLIGGLAQSVVTSSSGVAMGPAPKGCSKYEIIVGAYQKLCPKKDQILMSHVS